MAGVLMSTSLCIPFNSSSFIFSAQNLALFVSTLVPSLYISVYSGLVTSYINFMQVSCFFKHFNIILRTFLLKSGIMMITNKIEIS